MAKAPAPAAAAAETYDPAKQYQVKLTRPVKAIGLKLTPLAEITIQGDALNAIVKEHGADVVAIAATVA